MAENPYLGKNQAKETLVQYLRKLINRLSISNCDGRQMVNKYSSMKKKYEETNKGIHETGQGVKDDDPESFPEKVKSICHYYYILDTILGTSQAVNTSYQRDSGLIFTCDTLDEHQTLAGEDEMEIGGAEPSNEDEVRVEREFPADSDSENTIASSASKFQAALTSKLMKSKKETIQSSLVNYLTQREEKRILIEEKKLEWEKEKWNKEMELRTAEKDKEMELELEKAKLNQVVDLTKLEIEKEIQLKKLEMQTN